MLPRMAGLSLTQRSQAIFAVASAVALAAVAVVPWIQAQPRAIQAERVAWRERVAAWGAQPATEESIRLVSVSEPGEAGGDPFVAAAMERFQSDPGAFDFDALTDQTPARLLYARALRGDELNLARAGVRLNLAVPDAAWRSHPLAGLVFMERPGAEVARQVAVDRVTLVVAVVAAWLGLQIVVRTLVVRGYLRAVRRLRDVADRVRGGDLKSRSTLRTGDELQQLGESFNAMVEALEAAQERLEAINRTLDLKVGELSQANVGLFESNRLKSEFLANVSHELRTPLNSILGFAELLAELARNDAAADPKRLRYISHIQSSGRGLLEMINELLDMAKIEAGRMEVAVHPVSVDEVVEGIGAIMRPVAEAKGVSVRVDRPEGLPTVETDAGKLQQILYNFMSNAVKFSPEGGEVTLAAERVEREGGDAVRLSVVDQGPGISADMQQAVFEKFRQVDASHTKRHGGTGLGLAICRELATLLGAGVGLRSAPGKGSTFWVEVPVQFQARKLPPLMAGRPG